MTEEKDEIDLFLDSQVKTEKELLQEKCEKTYYAASSQTRRDLMRTVCFLGKSKEELLKETGLDETTLKFHTEILINADFLFRDKKGIYRLTKLGLQVLPKL